MMWAWHGYSSYSCQFYSIYKPRYKCGHLCVLNHHDCLFFIEPDLFLPRMWACGVTKGKVNWIKESSSAWRHFLLLKCRTDLLSQVAVLQFFYFDLMLCAFINHVVFFCLFVLFDKFSSHEVGCRIPYLEGWYAYILEEGPTSCSRPRTYTDHL